MHLSILMCNIYYTNVTAERSTISPESCHYSTQLKECLRADVEQEMQDKRLKTIEDYVQLSIQLGDYIRREERRAYNILHLESVKEGTVNVEMNEIFDVRSEWTDRHEAPKTVLIKGRAGIGKSTLLRKLSRDWSENILWEDRFNNVYRIPLKFLNAITESLSCNDLLMKHHGPQFSPEEKAQVWKEIKENPDKTLITFDGLDEYRGLDDKEKSDIPKVYDNDAKVPLPILLCNLQSRNLLTGAQVVFTSRPRAAGLRCFTKFDRELEIKGFNQDQIKDYIRKYCGGDRKKAEQIIAYLDDSSDLRSYCYIPALCSFIVSCISLIIDSSPKQSSEWHTHPQTITQLMTLIVINFVIQHHDKYKYNKPESPWDVLPELKESFQKLAKLAAWGMMATPVRLTFTTEDIKAAINIEISHEELQFGLLTATKVPSHLLFETITDNWSFIHLLFQEFLGACHLVGQPLQDVLDLLAMQSHHGQHDMLRMFHMGVLVDESLQRPLADVLPLPQGGLVKKTCMLNVGIFHRQ